jgi:hypothetical protein
MEKRLPPRFYWDHVSRDLPAGKVVSETQRYVRVELTQDDYEELLSDAKHYAYSMAVGGFEDRGLIASARATVKALDPAGMWA